MPVKQYLPLCVISLALVLVAGGVPLPAAVPAQDHRPPPGEPLYPPGKGPVVVVDEAHFNFHTIGGRYREFARTLERDGYVVRRGESRLTADSLRGTGILVIATPLSGRNRNPANWSPPVHPAFDRDEIREVRQWVRHGGSLLLIADHLPFAGAMEGLAAAFGFELLNGYALDRREILQATLDRPFVFTRDGRNADGTLGDHAITRGRGPSGRVERVMTFMGAAFRAREPAHPLLTLGEFVDSYQTETFGKLSATTPSIEASGLMQAAARHYGEGKVVFIAEAGMFGFQWQAGKPVGMNHPGASGNHLLLLNTMHWLDGTLE